MLAFAAGFDLTVANVIAAADQRVDDSSDTSAGASFAARRDYHFTTASRRDNLWVRFEASGDAEDLGVYLHALQDSFSHEGYGPDFGHLAAGHAPDLTHNDPEKADQMAAASYVKLVEAAETMGLESTRRVPYAAISGLVQLFNDAETEEEKLGIVLQMRELVNEHRASTQD
jgi:hypothetical protein